MFPSVSATRPCGPEFAMSSGNSLISPDSGSSRPSLLASCAAYHSDPSGATAGSCGPEFGVGASHSLIDTVTPAKATRMTPAVSVAANALPSTRHPPFQGCSRQGKCQNFVKLIRMEYVKYELA